VRGRVDRVQKLLDFAFDERRSFHSVRENLSVLTFPGAMTSAAFNNRVNDCAAMARIGITEKPESVDGNVELESHPLVGLRAPPSFSF
jgi:hypothetical protein